MQLEHSFSVPVGVDEAWEVLLDIERVAPCMPGAAIDSVEGDDFTGTVKVKLGPINLTYKGNAGFTEKDAAAHRAVIVARGRDARGNGTAAATVTATLRDEDGSTHVAVQTDLDITGRPAQFGRGVMVDVGNKLIGQFADCLAGKLAASDPAPAPPSQADEQPVTAEPNAPTGPLPTASEATTAELPAAGKAPAKKAAAKKTPAKPVAAKKAPAKAAAKKTPAKKTAAKKAPTKKAATKAPAEKTAAAATAPPTKVTTEQAPPETVVEALSPAPSDNVPSPAVPPVRPPETVGWHAAPDEVEPIDLLQSAGPAVAKRLAPAVVALIAVLIVLQRALSRRHPGD